VKPSRGASAATWPLAAIRSPMEQLAGASGELGPSGGVMREAGRAFSESPGADRNGS
jgi:hypothetical protein